MYVSVDAKFLSTAYTKQIITNHLLPKVTLPRIYHWILHCLWLIPDSGGPAVFRLVWWGWRWSGCSHGEQHLGKHYNHLHVAVQLSGTRWRLLLFQRLLRVSWHDVQPLLRVAATRHSLHTRPQHHRTQLYFHYPCTSQERRGVVVNATLTCLYSTDLYFQSRNMQNLRSCFSSTFWQFSKLIP